MLAPNNVAKRESLGIDILQDVDIPELVENQLKSYEEFLQIEKLKSGQSLNERGLQEVFKEIFPIENAKKTHTLHYKSYRLELESMEYTEEECVKKRQTYAAPLKVMVSLYSDETGEIRERELYFGDIPLMTERGTFIINGAERVVVSQIHRSPGVVFEWGSSNYRISGTLTARIIPYKGSWMEFEIDNRKRCIWVKIDKYGKVLSTLFLRVLGFDTREKIIKVFYPDSERVKLTAKNSAGFVDRVLSKPVDIKGADGEFVYYKNAGEKLLHADLEDMLVAKVKEIELIEGVDMSKESDQLLINCFEQEAVLYQDEGMNEPSLETVCQVISTALKMKDRFETDKIQSEVYSMFFDRRRYDLGRVGRFKLNKKFDYDSEFTDTTLIPEDIANTIKFLMALYRGEERVDDIDHLGNRRVRIVGELIALEFKKALARVARSAREKLALKERRNDIRLQDLITIKPILSTLKEFFGSSQLCQFMDQVNPLAALTHRRRLNALGPGGLSRERAGFDVRDVHYSHYGRVCPIESPEGPNIGLIMSLTNYAKVNEYGFLETPYRKVVKGKVTNKVEYLTAMEEDKYFIAQADVKLDANGNFLEDSVPVRKKGDYITRPSSDVGYMDRSPRQIISVSTALIPFLEHDDANRALMGSNMQRQAVPLLYPQPPRVGTGMEFKAAYDSGVLIKATRTGKVTAITNERIEITPNDATNDEDKDIYNLIKYKRTNQDTCLIHKTVVVLNQSVKKGAVIADGAATVGGELALGRNILVGFLPWNGYNFEDAILVSEKLVKNDVFTSLHIKEFSIEVHETRQGVETITKDIPNVPERMRNKLDDDGIIYVGAKVQANDILVGKITPKSESEIEPEKKLITHLFGEKGREIRDTSLRLTHGVEGTVVGIRTLKRKNGDQLAPGVEEVIVVSVAAKRRLKEGDKMAGRHGNKGVVARIVPEEDMPHMEDGTALEICLSPLGVPSRMNIGQLLETALGWAGLKLDKWFALPVFDSPSTDIIESLLQEAGIPKTSKVQLYDGKTGDAMKNPVTVGCVYMLKLHHLVDEKMHARCTGTYSLVTQQPLGGKAQLGGQRLGEMEVWALEAYGAANILNEFITVKSDDIQGRLSIYESIVKGKNYTDSGVPESFRVLMHELRALGLDISVYDPKGKQIPLTERDEEIIKEHEQNF